jgi:DNA-binding XRE family transcriptional regulator
VSAGVPTKRARRPRPTDENFAERRRSRVPPLSRHAGAVFARRRADLGLSQPELARAAGLSRQGLAAIEQGYQRLYLDQFVAIEAALAAAEARR